jgi:parallel beta-helix repeat protein
MATYYVSGAGSNSNNGLSPDAAFRSIQKAADLTQPGDTVLVMNGTYTNDNPNQNYGNVFTILRSGRSDAWITYKAYPGHTPKIQADNNWYGILVSGASYINIEGFDVVGSLDSLSIDRARQVRYNNVQDTRYVSSGIGVGPEGANGFAHHINIRNNRVSKFSATGIGSSKADYVKIENNIVSDTSFYSPYGTSAISIFQAPNFDNNTGDYKLVVRGNVAYNNKNLIPAFAKDYIADGNGIIIDTLRNIGNSAGAPGLSENYRGKTLVENNLVYKNGGRGIVVYDSDNVDVFNNTSYQNLQNSDLNDGEIVTGRTINTRVFNNIFYGRGGQTANIFYDVQNVQYDHNLIYNTSSFYNPDPARNTRNIVGQDPLLENPGASQFKLKAGSPAIDSGTFSASVWQDIIRMGRPQGSGIDIGAYEASSGVRQGGAGGDYLEGTPDNDVMNGGDGNDFIEGFFGGDRLSGDGGNDFVLGYADDDVLLGGGGNDQVYAGVGNDVLNGEWGSDYLVGAEGTDIFVVAPNQGQDFIEDFQDGVDKIQLSGGLSFGSLNIYSQGGFTVVSAGNQGLVTVKNISPSQLTSGDFVVG